MRLAATGDSIVTRSLLSGADFVEPVRELLQQADVAFTNLETPLPSRPSTPGVLPKGMHVQSRPFAAHQLRELGFSVVNLANNHAVDYSVSGLVDTMMVASGAGLATVGAGLTLEEARRPRYLETPEGRIAFLAATSSNAALALAADPGGGFAGRPGVNPLRYSTEYGIARQQLELLREIDDDLGTARTRRLRVAASKSRSSGGTKHDDQLDFLGHHFLVKQPAGVSTRAHIGDVNAIAERVAAARREADVVVVSIHAHEGQTDGWNTEEPADFLVEAAHAWVDAGADAIIGHGPHCLRGVEVYRGKPILYSLGNFIFMLESVDLIPPEQLEVQALPSTALPAEYHRTWMETADGNPRGFMADDRFWTSVMAVLTFESDRAEVELVPVNLGRLRGHVDRGIPGFAEPEVASGILRTVQRLSAPFGTEIRTEMSHGWMRGMVALETPKAGAGPEGEQEAANL